MAGGNKKRKVSEGEDKKREVVEVGTKSEAVVPDGFYPDMVEWPIGISDYFRLASIIKEMNGPPEVEVESCRMEKGKLMLSCWVKKPTK